MAPEPEPELPPGVDLLRFNLYNSAFVVVQQGVVYPFELLKTRVQIGHATGSEVAAMVEQYHAVVAERGMIRGLFHGFPWLAGPLLVQEGLYYTSYVLMKDGMHAGVRRHVSPEYRESVDFAIPFVAGGLAECTNTVIAVPTDILTQRLQILPGGMEGSGPAVLRSVIAEQGVTGLFRGTTVTIVSYVPFSAVWFGTYEALKSGVTSLTQRSGRASGRKGGSRVRSVGGESWVPEVWLHAGCGGIAGTVATVVTNPIDVVKTRIQTFGAPSYLSANASGPQQLAQMAAGGTQGSWGSAGHAALRQRAAWYHMRYHLAHAAAETSWAPAEVTRTVGDTGLRAIGASMGRIFREEGMAGLMRGVVPRTLFNAPSSALSLVCYEAALKLATPHAFKKNAVEISATYPSR